MAEKTSQVKITLPAALKVQLTQEAATKGLSLAAYLRMMICERQLRPTPKNAKMNTRKKAHLTWQQMADVL